MSKLKPLALDRNSGNAIQGGTESFVFTVAMTGEFVAVTIPAGQNCKAVCIKVTNNSEFQFSQTKTAGDAGTYIPYSALSMDVAAVAGTILGYIKATNTTTLAVHLIK